MALTTCADCGKEISTGAAACPHCGRRVPARTSVRRIGVLLGVAFVLLAFGAYAAARDFDRAKGRAGEQVGQPR